MIVNLSEIKRVVDLSIKRVEDGIEVSGMEGDMGYVEYLQEELDTLIKVKTELNAYGNTNLSVPFLVHSLGVAAPTLDMTYLIKELQNYINHKELELLQMAEKIQKEKDLLANLKASVDAPKSLTAPKDNIWS